MKNKVIYAALGISAVAAISGGIYLGNNNTKLEQNLTDEKESLEVLKKEQAEDLALIESSEVKVVELNELAGNVQIELDELHERMNNMSFVEGYVIEPVDNETMYIQEDTNLRIGPSTDYKVAGEIDKNTEVTVIGKVTNAEGKTWYVISSADEDKIETGVNDTNILGKNEDGTDKQHHMVSSSLLGNSKPAAPAKPKQPTGGSINCDCDNSCDNSGGTPQYTCDNTCDCDCDSYGGMPVDPCASDWSDCDICDLNFY